MEKLSILNPSAVDFAGAGGGSTPELQPCEILLGCIKCKPAYVSLLLCMSTYTRKRDHKQLVVMSEDHDFCLLSEDAKKFIYYEANTKEYVFTLSAENEIVSDCKKDYKYQATMLLRSKGKRKPLHDDEIAILARCAIISKIQNLRQDKDYAEYIGVDVPKFVSRYRASLDQCFLLIERELSQVRYHIYKRLGKE